MGVTQEDGQLVPGRSGAFILGVELKVTAGDVLTLAVGAGGAGKDTAGSKGYRGGDSVVRLNERELIRLSGGASGEGVEGATTLQEHKQKTSVIADDPAIASDKSEIALNIPRQSYGYILDGFSIDKTIVPASPRTPFTPYGTGGGVFDGDDALGYGCRSGEGGRGLLIVEYIEPLN